MAAFIWNANPAKWQAVTPTVDNFAALGSYITDQSRYVYWSTPVLRDEIQVGDQAFIWRTKYKSKPNGIIAIGMVAELPKDLSLGESGFANRSRLPAPGWSETKAPSSWKTGIRIEQTFWDTPLQIPMRPSQGTLRRLTAAETALIAKSKHF